MQLARVPWTASPLKARVSRTLVPIPIAVMNGATLAFTPPMATCLPLRAPVTAHIMSEQAQIALRVDGPVRSGCQEEVEEDCSLVLGVSAAQIICSRGPRTT